MQPKKIVKIPVWDLEIDEIIEMEIDQEDLDAMDAADAEVDRKFEEALAKDREAMRFTRGDE